MAEPSIGQVTSREIKRVLSEARWTVSEAARRLEVDRRTVHRWLKGEKVDLADLSRLAELTGKSIVLRLGHEEAAPPDWAERLANETAEKVISALTTPAQARQVETLIARLERLLPLPGAASPDRNDESDPAESTPPEQSVG